MIIGKDKVVSLTYDLRLDSHEGDMVEQTTEENPLEFVFGTGSMLAKFEENLENLKVNDTFQFKLDCADAYGYADDEQIVELPLTMFEVDGEIKEGLLEIGNSIPMQDQNGNRFNGTVAEVGEETVTIDFNHPLADEDLYFSGRVIEIRDASPEEIESGHPTHEHCCGCGKH